MSTRGESLSCYRLASVYLPASRSGCPGNRLSEKVLKTEYSEGGGGGEERRRGVLMLSVVCKRLNGMALNQVKTGLVWMMKRTGPNTEPSVTS